MRRRSTTNSRPWENLPLRREYARQNPDCELSQHLSGPVWAGIRYAWQFASVGVCQHHIFHGATKRPDLWSNLITVWDSAHAFCHQCPVEGTIACLWIKRQKGELDMEEVRQALGYNLPAYLEKSVLTDDRESWRWDYEQMRLDLLEGI